MKLDRRARRDGERVVRRGLGAGSVGRDRLRLSVDDIVVECVLRVGRALTAEDALEVGFVFAEEQRRIALTIQAKFAQLRVRELHRARALRAQARPRGVLVPAPGVAKTNLRQELQAPGLGATIDGADPDQGVVRSGLGVLDEHVEVAALVEHPRVQQLELGTLTATTAVLFHQPRVRELGLWILVQHLQVRVRGRRIEIVVLLLHVLAVIALLVGEPEQALLEDRITLVPQRDRKTDALLVIGVASDAVLTPTVGAAARVVVREVIPGRAKFAVILANRAPLAFAQVRAEAPPHGVEGGVFGEPLALYRSRSRYGH